MKNEKMIKAGKIMILGVVILVSGCARNVVPSKEKVQKREDTIEVKTEKIENFNYLFTEALKQKIFGNYKNAMKYFLECEKIKPDDAVEYQISGIFAISGQSRLAIKFGEKALLKDPGNIWYYYQLASEYQMFGDKDSLINIYEKIVKRFPYLIKNKITLGDLYVQNNNPEKGNKIYYEVEKKYGKTLELERKIIEAYKKEGKPDKALNEIRNAMAIFGCDKDLLLSKAEILQMNGKKEEAGILYENLLNTYKNNPKIDKAVYEQYIKENEYKKALDLLGEIIDNDQITQSKKLDYMFQVIYMNDPEMNIDSVEIGNLVKKVYKKEKNDLRTQLLMVDYLTKRERYEEAMQILRSMIDKYPLFKIGWQQILFITDMKDSADSVIYYANKGNELFKEDPLFNVYLCSAYLKKNKNEKVIEYAENGIKKVSQKGVNYVEKETGIKYKMLVIQLYSYLGEAYKNLKEYKKSDQAFEEGLKIDPGNLILLNNYSYYLSLRREKMQKALKMSGETIKKEPQNSTYLDTYGWILHNMGKEKEAEKYIRKALNNGGDNSPDILEHYGDILFKKGKNEEAIKYWNKAIQEKGNKERLRKKIESVKDE